MGVDTLFFSLLVIHAKDESRFHEAKKAIETHTKNIEFSWIVEAWEGGLGFRFIEKSRMHPYYAAKQLLGIAKILRDHGYKGSAITPYEASGWTIDEAGCLFYDVSEDSATIKMTSYNSSGKRLIYQNYKIRVSLSIFE